MLELRLSIAAAIVSGIRADVRIQPKPEAEAIIIITIAVDLAAAIKSAGIFVILSSLWIIRPTMKPYTTATAAASVGVKIPP